MAQLKVYLKLILPPFPQSVWPLTAPPCHDTTMTTSRRLLTAILLLSATLPRCSAVELHISRDALERTLKQQLFGGPDGRYYVKGAAQTPCFTYAEDPKLRFVTDHGESRIVVTLKTRSKLGQKVGGSCIGISLALPAEVSLAPEGDGETIGFRDARIDRVSSHQELNFILQPFLSHQVPSSMKVNAADLLRQSLAGSTASSGYKVTLDRLKIHSVQIQGDDLVVDVDANIAIR